MQNFFPLISQHTQSNFLTHASGIPADVENKGGEGGGGGRLESIHEGSIGGGGGLKMLSKNTFEGVHLLIKLPTISLQAYKFTKDELLHKDFS